MRPRLWLAIFVLLQLADGVLTYAAVTRFGASVEGNPILATWMLITGAAPALIGAKLLACGCGAVLYATGVHGVLAGLSALYLFVAVVPWLQIFSQLGLS
jgi:arginine exporter protein ArgO